MIVPMTKYDFVLYHRQKDDFLNRLQDLGLVDITTTGWEPDEKERELMISIDKHRQAVKRLRELAAEEGYTAGTPLDSAEEAYNCYLEASSKEEDLNSRIRQAEKEVEDLRVWGEFDPASLRALVEGGVTLHYFSAYTKEFESHREDWSSDYNLVPINDMGGITYFVVVTAPGETVELNAQEIKAPSMDFRQKQQEIMRLEKERDSWTDQLRRCAASVDLIEQLGEREEEKLRFSQVNNSAREEAEGSLLLMEGWATKETAVKVDGFLEEYPGLFYIKANPTPEDETPVLLKNNRFNRMFEFIGNFYSLPRYGTMDLTWAFGPFYVLFFGLCLADAGYGLLVAIAGLVIAKKQPKIKSIGMLAALCGVSTIICGIFLGSFFGIQFTEYEPFAAFRNYVLSTDNLFVLALGIGVFQILFGMILKVFSYTHQFGFRYALSTIGWILVIVSSLCAYLLPGQGIEGFSFSSPAYLACLGVGAFMMLFLNSPGKNPFVNLGSGLWNTYNDVTGILSDVLSYIRLFAIGLSGGTLALVFNDLAVGLSPDIPVVKQLVIIIILLIGHSINLFMSVLSSFVHPMRLTFVEFYKNAGFETTQRAFAPFRRNQKLNDN